MTHIHFLSFSKLSPSPAVFQSTQSATDVLIWKEFQGAIVFIGARRTHGDLNFHLSTRICDDRIGVASTAGSINHQPLRPGCFAGNAPAFRGKLKRHVPFVAQRHSGPILDWCCSKGGDGLNHTVVTTPAPAGIRGRARPRHLAPRRNPPVGMATVTLYSVDGIQPAIPPKCDIISSHAHCIGGGHPQSCFPG